MSHVSNSTCTPHLSCILYQHKTCLDYKSAVEDRKRMKRSNSFRRTPNIDANNVLGVFALLVTYQPYFVSEANRNKIQSLVTYLLGNTIKVSSETEAIDALFLRDHEDFVKLLNKKITIEQFGSTFLPPVFFSKAPDVIHSEEFGYKIAIAKETHKAMPKTDHLVAGTLQGDMAERKVFDQLKNHFDFHKDACLILHSHYFLQGNNAPEKDFIILNLSKGYIMIIEVKATAKYFAKAKDQLKDSRERVQALFNTFEHMSNEWKYVGVCYIDNGDCGFYNGFVIHGFDEFLTSFKNIEDKVSRNHTEDWVPNEHIQEFVAISKQLLYQAQGKREPLLRKSAIVNQISQDLDKASVPENIFFWTPEQFSIVQSMHIDYMCLMGYYGTGKTILLVERAEQLSRDPQNMVYFFVDCSYGKKQLLHHFERKFAGKPNIKVKPIALRDLQMQPWPLKGTELGLPQSDPDQNYVIIDEAFMVNLNAFVKVIKSFQTQVKSIWFALGNIEESQDVDLRKGIEELNFIIPTLENCLRNGSRIANFSQTLLDGPITRLEKFRHQMRLRRETDVNVGMLHQIQEVSETDIGILGKALQIVPSKSFIFIRHSV